MDCTLVRTLVHRYVSAAGAGPGPGPGGTGPSPPIVPRPPALGRWGLGRPRAADRAPGDGRTRGTCGAGTWAPTAEEPGGAAGAETA